jgi:hypothetical protein
MIRAFARVMAPDSRAAKVPGDCSTSCRASLTRHAAPPGDRRSINATSARADSTACTAVIPAAGAASALATNWAISSY